MLVTTPYYHAAATPGASSIDRMLDEDVVIESTTFTPIIQAVARDAASSQLVDRAQDHALTETGTGASPTYGVKGMLGDVDTFIRFAGAKYLTAQNGTVFDLDQQDLVVEILAVKRAGATQERIYSKFDSAGLLVQTLTSDNLQLYLEAAGGTGVVTTSSPIPDGLLYLAHCFVEHGVAARWALNKAYSGSASNLSGETGSLASAASATLGGSSVSQSTCGLYLFALYAADGALSSPDHLAWHQSRYDLLATSE